MSISPNPLIDRQASLFAEELSFDPSLARLARTDLGRGAWIDHLVELVRGHEAVLEVLWATTRLEAHRRRMYERIVDLPTLAAGMSPHRPPHPPITRASHHLSP